MSKLRNLDKIAIVLSMIVFLLINGSVYALERDDKPQQKPAINQSQAIKSAQQRFEGRVLRVDRLNQNYRIKMLQKSGRVVSVDVNSNTGRVIQLPSKPLVQKEK